MAVEKIRKNHRRKEWEDVRPYKAKSEKQRRKERRDRNRQKYEYEDVSGY